MKSNLFNIVKNIKDKNLSEAIVESYLAIFEELKVPESIKSWLANSKVKYPVYHATGKSFDKFDINKTSPDNYFGTGIYFSDSPDDVDKNYANKDAKDTSHKLYNAIEDFQDKNKYKISQYIEEFLKTTYPKWKNETIQRKTEELTEFFVNFDDEIPEKYIEKFVIKPQTKYRTIPAYIKLENPIDLRKKSNIYFDFSYGSDDAPAYEPNNEDEIKKAEEKGMTYDEYYDELVNEFESNLYDSESTGELYEFLTKIKELCDDPDEIGNLIANVIGRFSDGGQIYKIVNYIRENPTAYYADDYEQSLPNLMRLAFEEMGYDGIIHDPDPMWGMDIEPGTSHYIVFDPANIRSAISGTEI